MFRSLGDIIRPPEQKDVDGKIVSSYSCGLCDEGGWWSETEVAIHGRLHKDKIKALVKRRSPKKPVCLTCISTLSSTSSLISHFKTVHLHSSPTARRVEREIFICDTCQQIFFNKRLLEIHISRRHTQLVNMLFCPICSKKLKPQGIWTHFQSHKMQSVSTCPICLTKCLNRENLRLHIQNHQRYFNCDICGYATLKESLFNSHIDSYKKRDLVEELDKDKDYNKYFLKPHESYSWTNAVLSYGLKGMKIFNKIFICVMCREICLDRAQMSSHIHRDHSHSTPNTTKKHQCSCGEVFMNQVLLKHHVFKLKGSHCVRDNNVPTSSTDNSTLLPSSPQTTDKVDKEDDQSTMEVISIEEIVETVSAS